MPTSVRLATIKRIQEIYTKLSNEALVSEELEELVGLTSDLQESAIILRYKAAEERVFENETIEAPVVVETPIEEVVEEVAPELEEKEKPSEIDFSIFDKPEEEIAEVVSEKAEETFDFDNKVEEVETVSEETKVEVPINDVNWSSYFEKVLKDHSTAIQTPLSALAGSFGLNERILYINELFAKEAEVFSELIQKLDGVGDWNNCVNVLSSEAESRSWNKENDTTGEFILHIKRRYA